MRTLTQMLMKYKKLNYHCYNGHHSEGTMDMAVEGDVERKLEHLLDNDFMVYAPQVASEYGVSGEASEQDYLLPYVNGRFSQSFWGIAKNSDGLSATFSGYFLFHPNGGGEALVMKDFQPYIVARWLDSAGSELALEVLAQLPDAQWETEIFSAPYLENVKKGRFTWVYNNGNYIGWRYLENGGLARTSIFAGVSMIAVEHALIAGALYEKPMIERLELEAATIYQLYPVEGYPLAHCERWAQKTLGHLDGFTYLVNPDANTVVAMVKKGAQ